MTIEEGEHVRVSIVHDDNGADGLARVADESPGSEEYPELAWDVTAIPRRDFDPPTLAKLCRGIEYGAQLVVVGGNEKELSIDGVARIRRRTTEDRQSGSPRRDPVRSSSNSTSPNPSLRAGREVPRPIDVVDSPGPARRAIGAIFGDGGSDTMRAGILFVPGIGPSPVGPED